MSNAIDYNAIAQTYANNRSASPVVLAHILEQMHDFAKTEILEIGCGTANHLYALSSAWGVRGKGFDQSKGMIFEGKEKNPNLELTTGDASGKFPYADRLFDLAFSVDVIHYIRDLPAYFTQACRVLKPGGVALTVTDSEDDIPQRSMSHYFPETMALEYERYHPVARIEKAMRSSGFQRTWVTHTRREFVMNETHLEKFRNKAYSAVRLITEEQFSAGLARLEADVQLGVARGSEVYTYIWGVSKDPPGRPSGRA